LYNTATITREKIKIRRIRDYKQTLTCEFAATGQKLFFERKKLQNFKII
jgi:hypothetical protein